MSYLMEQAGGQAFTGKQRVSTVVLARFAYGVRLLFLNRSIMLLGEKKGTQNYFFLIEVGFTNLQALDLVPKKIHERSPIFLGSYDDVEEIKELYAAFGAMS